MYLTYFKISWKEVGWGGLAEKEKEFRAGHPELNPQNVATGFATGVLSSHVPSPRVQVMASGEQSSSPICHLGFLSSSLAPGHLPQELALSLW